MGARIVTATVLCTLLSGAAADAQTRLSLAGPSAGSRPPAAATEVPQNTLEDQNDSIVAVVNSDVVSDRDLRQRIALFAATSGAQLTPEMLKRIKPQILEQLEAEKIQIQEAKRKNLTVNKPEIDKSIDHIVTDNNMKLEQLQAMLASHGVEFQTLRGQIAAQVLWQKTVSDEFQDRINVSEADINAELARVSVGANKRHYLVAEIFLSVDSPDQDGRVLKNANDIEQQIQAGAPFQALARQFSQSPSAAAGGDIGWVFDGQLAKDLNDALIKMSPGSISQPVRSTGGYYILLLRDQQEPANAKLPAAPVEAPKGPTDRLPLARILLPLGPKPTQKLAEGAMKLGVQISEHIVSCVNADKIAAKVPGSVYMNLGVMKLKELSQQMQDAIAKTQPGQTAAPFLSPAGVEIIARCDKALPKAAVAFHMPTRQEVEEQLFDAQVTAFARRYMRDLRRQANIETR